MNHFQEAINKAKQLPFLFTGHAKYKTEREILKTLLSGLMGSKFAKKGPR